MRQFRIVLALALLAVYPQVSEASSIAIVFGGCSNLSASNLTGAPLSLSDGCTIDGVTTNLQGAASLSTLRFYVDTNGPGGNPVITGTSAGAVVTISDFVTITGGTGSGTATFNWAIDGTLSVSSPAGFSIAIFNDLFYWQECGSTWTSYCESFPSVTGSPVNQIVSVSFPFTYDVPFQSYFQLRGGTSAGVVDFFNTAALQPLFLTDTTGAQVTGVTAVSDSGFQYSIAAPAAPAAVPEPGSLVLLGTGVAAVITRIRRRSHR